MTQNRFFHFAVFGLLVAFFAFAKPALALDGPNTIRIDGYLTDENDLPINAGSVDFTIQIFAEHLPTCLLYQETQTFNFANQQGNFSLEVGVLGTPLMLPTNFTAVFDNSADPTDGTCGAHIFSANENRIVKIVVDDGVNPSETLDGPTIMAVPYAMLANKVVGSVGVEQIASSTAQYFSYKPNNVECTDADLLKWEAATDRWICYTPPAAATGDITEVVAGAGLAGGATAGSATLDVGAGNGINVGADAISVRDGSGLGFSAGDLQINEGSGLEIVADILNVKVGTGLTITSDAVVPDFGTTAGKVMAGDQAAAGDVSGTIGTLSVDKIKGATVNTTGIATGKILKYDGPSTSWVIADDENDAADNLGNHTATANLNMGSNWISGDGAAEGLYVTAAGDVGVGTNTPGGKLEVAGQVKITGGTPGAGKVLTSDLNGLATWETPSSGWSGTATSNLQMANYLIYGSATSSGNLNLDSTSHATKGFVRINPNGGSVGIGVPTTPANVFHVNKNAAEEIGILVTNENASAGATSAIVDVSTSYGGATWKGATLASYGNAFTTNRLFVANSTSLYSWKDSTAGLRIGVEADSAPIVFFTDGVVNSTEDANERMRITSTGQIGIGTSTPNSSAILDLSSTDKGFLAPRLTNAARDGIASPATGLQIFNTTSNKLEFWDGASWQPVGGGGWSGTATSDLDMNTFDINFTTGDIVMGTGDIVLGTTNYISGDGGPEGLSINSDGRLSINSMTDDKLAIGGTSFIKTTALTGMYIGQSAGNIASTAINNVGIGPNSLDANTTGSFNTTVGSNTLTANTTGGNNSAFGYYSLASNTVGTDNSAFGFSAQFGATGEQNSSLGAYSLYATNGTHNTAIGYLAGGNLEDGSRNIFIGAQAGPTGLEDFSNRLYISNNADDSPLIYGDFSTDQLKINGTLQVCAADGTGCAAVTGGGGGDNLGSHYASQDLKMEGFTIFGNDIASGNLTLNSTSDGTKGDIILNPSGGNVGIGLPLPLAKLHVQSNAQELAAFESTATSGGVMIISSTNQVAMGIEPSGNFFLDLTNDSTSEIEIDSGSNHLIFRAPEGSPGLSANERVSFYTKDLGDELWAKAKDAAGESIDVLVGGLANAPIAYLPTALEDNHALVWDSGNLEWTYAPNSADNLGNHTATANLKLGAFWLSGDGANEGVFVNATGAVGIGNGNPASQLDIVGPSSSGTIRISDNTTNSNPKASSIVSSHFTNAEQPVTLLSANMSGANNLLRIGGGSGTQNAATRISFFTGANVVTISGSEKMTIDSAGNVGIGTNSPTNTLHVLGSLRIVDGSQGGGKILTSDSNGVASWQFPTTPGSATITGGPGSISIGQTELIRLQGYTGTGPHNITLSDLIDGKTYSLILESNVDSTTFNLSSAGKTFIGNGNSIFTETMKNKALVTLRVFGNDVHTVVEWTGN